MEDLLLKDYMPHSLLVTEEHVVEKPKFPAVDAHNHLGFPTDAFGETVAGEGTERTADVGKLVETMDRCGITAICNLTGRWGDDLKRLLDRYEGGFPGRFYTFANVDWSRVNEPGFGEWAAAQLGESVRAGARGLKIFKNLGLRLKNASGKLIPPDDERLDPLWAKAGELGVPVLIHVADDMPFFQPLDRFNEYYLLLKRYPEWHFYGPEFPSHRELVEAGIRLIARHPETTFITAHTGWYSDNDLRFVGEQMLDKLPNMVTDFSTCLYTLGRQPYSARKFFIKYQDRILFGTDMIPSRQVYQTHFRFLETADEYFEAYDSWPGRHRTYGLDLPDEVLEKIYHTTVEKVVPGLA
jgi:predicted TIM-barrel fold metal-dependent hydrolase